MMSGKAFLRVGIGVFALVLATPGFCRETGSYVRGTITRIEGNKVTVTVESADKMTLKVGDPVSLKGRGTSTDRVPAKPKAGSPR